MHLLERMIRTEGQFYQLKDYVTEMSREINATVSVIENAAVDVQTGLNMTQIIRGEISNYFYCLCSLDFCLNCLTVNYFRMLNLVNYHVELHKSYVSMICLCSSCFYITTRCS